MVTENWVNISSGNGLLPASTNPSPEPMLTYLRSIDIHLRAICLKIPQPPITKISLKITYLKFYLNLPGANEFNLITANHPHYLTLTLDPSTGHKTTALSTYKIGFWRTQGLMIYTAEHLEEILQGSQRGVECMYIMGNNIFYHQSIQSFYETEQQNYYDQCLNSLATGRFERKVR